MWEPIESALTSSSRPARISLSTTFRAASHPTPFYARPRRPEATAVPGFRWGPSHEYLSPLVLSNWYFWLRLSKKSALTAIVDQAHNSK
jgi:hypothetical protein